MGRDEMTSLLSLLSTLGRMDAFATCLLLFLLLSLLSSLFFSVDTKVAARGSMDGLFSSVGNSDFLLEALGLRGEGG